MKHIIDAQGKKLGRVASEAAILLMGKNTPEFARNVAPNVIVEIINASKLDIDPKKLDDKYYLTHSGYPGGQKKEMLGDLMDRRGVKEVMRRAVKGMLPDNKLKARMIVNLIITE